MNLNGRWVVSQVGARTKIPATVPGCIHTDLLAAGKIEDPFYGDNEQKQFWIGKASWAYSRTFTVTPALLAHDVVRLVFDGLDTLATIRLNGHTLGTADNMFRAWAFDVKKLLRRGTNRLEVVFDSPQNPDHLKKYNCRKDDDGDKIGPRCRVRKEQCNFGWDWGPSLVTCGIWRPVRLLAWNVARLAEVQVLQDHARQGAVNVTARVAAECARAARLTAVIAVSLKGQELARQRVPLARGRGLARIQVKNPLLWWPRGMGDAHLYQVDVTLVDADETVLDTCGKRIGLRRLELIRQKDQWGESFHFAANGIPFFAKGANWIPSDQFQNRVTPEIYRSLLTSAAEANMNFLRVWGGGIYESDEFYDLCDELGLCVWQDFMFACGVYPGDQSFFDNVRAEAVENIRRLRHHACLALWCGNNEMEQGWDEWGWPKQHTAAIKRAYQKMFHKVLPALVASEDPERCYWPSSPSSGKVFEVKPNNDTMGDAHLWEVWHGLKPFEWYRTSLHRFCSEFGFQSFPEPRTVEGYTEPKDRNITSRVMELHQRSPIGNAAMLHYMLSWFRMPSGFENTLWLSQLQQGLAIKYAVEHWRRNMPRCMGALIWQLNDTWPVASWASIDYHGRWKALHYMAKKFFAPVLVSGLEDTKAGTVAVHLSSDRMEEVAGVLRWSLTTVAGKSLQRGVRKVTLPAGGTACVETLKLTKWIDKGTNRDLLVWLEFSVHGKVVSRDLVTFVRPKHLELADPALDVAVKPDGAGAYVVALKAGSPALWAWLSLRDTDAVFADNWICLEPGRAVEVRVKPAKQLSLAQFRTQLQVRSLFDLQ